MKYYIVLSFLVLLSCKKGFLEPTDSSNLNRQTYVNSLTTMEQFANGIQLMLDRDFQRSLTVVYGDLTADNVKPSSLTNTTLLLHYNWSQVASESTEDWVSSESTALNGEWKSGYLSIRAASFVIEDVDKYRGENPTRADKLKGQAYAIRAMIHLKLVNLFAQNYNFTNNGSHIGIPYITTSDITSPFKRVSVGQVYDNIITDLKESIRLMPEGVPDTRFMNRSAAQALLSRVYLYKGEFENAKKTALEVTAKHPLMTIAQGYPDKMYYNLSSNQTESLYQLTPAFVFNPVTIITTFAGSAFRGFTINFRPSKDIVDIIKENPNDIRNKWFLTDGPDYIVSKYPEGVAGLHYLAPSDYYHTIIRSTEMYLTVAEAAFETNDEHTARQYLNAVRKRADPTLPDLNTTGMALRDSIYKERRKELAFEGGRMADLQRWQMNVQRNDVTQGSTSTKLIYPSNKTISPIPIQDVRLAGIDQNKDY